MSGQIPAFKPTEWHKLGHWPVYLFGAEPWFGRGFSDTFNVLCGVRPRGLLIFDGEQTHEYFFKDVVGPVEEKFAEGTSFFTRLRTLCVAARSGLLAKQEEFARLVRKDQFPFIEQHVFPLYVQDNATAWIVFLFEQLHHDEIYESYRKLRGARTTEEFPTLVTPAIESETLAEQRAIVDGTRAVMRGKDRETAARELADRFGYLSIWAMNEPHEPEWYAEMIERMMQERSADDLDRELKQLQTVVERIRRDQAAVTISAALPENLRGAIEALRVCAEIRTRGDESVSTVGAMVRAVLKPRADQLQIPYKDLFLLNTNELARLAATGTIDRALLDQRKKGFIAFTTESFDLKVVIGPDAERIAGEFLKDENKAPQTSEVRGFVACSGKVSGRVRNITVMKSGLAFDAGDILVAPQTTVDFVPIMKRAGAIVTDQGGLTSHAAIVSRELGTPCIVGTKIATKVLKDGDEVEVDAEKGVVKILKHVAKR